MTSNGINTLEMSSCHATDEAQFQYLNRLAGSSHLAPSAIYKT